MRGEAYLAAKEGAAAISEFQKIVDHVGVIGNEPMGRLAHLGLGRAHAVTGDNARAKAEYPDFLNLWRDADRGILKQANAECTKLR